MNFPHHDPYWQSAADFLIQRFGERARIVGPNEFHELIPSAYPYDVIRHIDLKEMDAMVIHKGMLREVGRTTCFLLVSDGIPIWGNEVFVIFTLKDSSPAQEKNNPHFEAFYQLVAAETFPERPMKMHSEFSGSATVILMTTFNRPDRLRHALQGITALNAPILVVNDGSDSKHAAAYAGIYTEFNVRVLNLPDNRGLPTALNVGLSYWLADPMVEWISYIQDDVEVRSDLLVALSRIQDADKFPLLSGHVNVPEKIYGEMEIHGERVLLQRMSSGQHLHAHRSYWEKMLPIPAPYFQSPRKWPGEPLRGADEDWWISQWNPKSVVKQGKYIIVLPDLVRALTLLPTESTWDNPGFPSPALPAPRHSTEGFVPATFRKPARPDVASL